MLLNAVLLSYLSDVKMDKTPDCLVLSEIVNRTLYQKTDDLVKYRTPGNPIYSSELCVSLLMAEFA